MAGTAATVFLASRLSPLLPLPFPLPPSLPVALSLFCLSRCARACVYVCACMIVCVRACMRACAHCAQPAPGGAGRAHAHEGLPDRPRLHPHGADRTLPALLPSVRHPHARAARVRTHPHTRTRTRAHARAHAHRRVLGRGEEDECTVLAEAVVREDQRPRQRAANGARRRFPTEIAGG